ncbi:uncharacterized protein LOC128127355 [Lactuca sativa]|uniref:uncharacterized protein LOC128127355 n=1 Tax=Lactuca sativa TaxID=4236 RepID=UPI0022B009B3|nr:uncharacterized protein LOC128127355 [Lactuca sativa]
MDQEIASAIHKRTTIKPMGRAGDVNLMVKGKIDSKYHTVMFIRGEGRFLLRVRGSSRQPWFAPLKRLISQQRGERESKPRRRGISLNQPRFKPPRSKNQTRLLLHSLSRSNRRSPLGDSYSNLQAIQTQTMFLPNKNAPPSESDSESSDDEALGRGDTPPRSPTPEIPVRSQLPSPPPVSVPISIHPVFPIPTSLPSTSILIPDPIFTGTTTTTTTTGAHSTAPTPPVTTEPPVTTKPPTTTTPLSPTPSTDTTPILGGEDLEFDSTYFSPYRAAAQKNSQTVNASVDNRQRSLQAERSNLETVRQAIEVANATLHDNVNDRLTQLEAELAVENRIMDELDKRTSQLKMQNLKLHTATAELNDLKSEREVNEALVSNRDKKKKKIGEDDTNNEEDVYEKDPTKPFQKTKSFDKELEEKVKKQTAKLEQKQKEMELLEKKKSVFPEWTLDWLQRCAIDEPSTLWLKPVMSFGLENSKDAQFDMPIT